MADTQVNNSNGPRQAGLLFRLDTSGRADSIQTLSRVTFISSTRHFKVSNTHNNNNNKEKKVQFLFLYLSKLKRDAFDVQLKMAVQLLLFFHGLSPTLRMIGRVF